MARGDYAVGARVAERDVAEAVGAIRKYSNRLDYEQGYTYQMPNGDLIFIATHGGMIAAPRYRRSQH